MATTLQVSNTAWKQAVQHQEIRGHAPRGKFWDILYSSVANLKKLANWQQRSRTLKWYLRKELARPYPLPRIHLWSQTFSCNQLTSDVLQKLLRTTPGWWLRLCVWNCGLAANRKLETIAPLYMVSVTHRPAYFLIRIQSASVAGHRQVKQLRKRRTCVDVTVASTLNF